MSTANWPPASSRRFRFAKLPEKPGLSIQILIRSDGWRRGPERAGSAAWGASILSECEYGSGARGMARTEANRPTKAVLFLKDLIIRRRRLAGLEYLAGLHAICMLLPGIRTAEDHLVAFLKQELTLRVRIFVTNKARGMASLLLPA